MTTLFFTYSKNSKPRFSLQPAMLSLLLFFAAAFSNCNPTKNTEKNSITPYNKDDFKSLLWEMTGNGLRKPSYLFGTIHLIPEKQFFLSDLVKLKLTESKRLCLEIDLDDPSTVSASLKGVMRKGIILKDLLNADDYAFIVKKLDSRGIPISMVKTLKPLLVSTLLLEKTAEEKMVNYENELATIAKKQQKEIIGLESAEFQMAMLDSIPYEEQAKMLVDEARKTEGFGELREMIKLYKQQDIDAIYTYISQQSKGFNSRFECIMLSNRNDSWVKAIAEKANEMPTFFAVGAGHLGGEAGVIRQLRQKGYVLRPLF